MLAKKYRLTEKETKKVLQKWKPFFSHEIVLNIMKTNYNHNRFAIVLWAKSVKNNVERNFFRRRFYDTVFDKVNYNWWNDLVFVVKKTMKLDRNNIEQVNSFIKELNFLIDKI